MAEAGRLTLPRTPARRLIHGVTGLRIAIIAAVLVCWEALARSGLLYQDVVPSLFAIASALAAVLTEPMVACTSDLTFGPVVLRWTIPQPDFFCHLGRTLYEIGIGLVIGGLTGLVTGFLLGGSR